MCGFFISNNKKVSVRHGRLIESLLRFRGPDASSGLINHNGWYCYHSRLAIIEVSSGSNQPMIDSGGGILLFNGEILNYKELGLKYLSKTYTSDTKLLSDLLSGNYLVDFNELDGFFSFVYIDRNGMLKHAVRDQFGVKPLYYHEDNDGISFCSEPIVLKRIFKCGIDTSSIDEYFATRAPIFSGSYFDGIEVIPPGTCFVNGRFFDCGDYICGDYKSISDDDLLEGFEKGLKSRLVSDTPVGLLLSKGVDSNLLRSIGSFDKYYTIGFEGDEDLNYLMSLNLEGLTAVKCTPEEYLDAFTHLLDLRGEPMSVPNEVMLYIVALKASTDDGIKVLLSGEGADEFFGGYDRIFNWAASAEVFDLDVFLKMYCYSKPDENSNIYKQFREVFSQQSFPSVFETVRWFFIRYHMPILFRRLDFALMAAGVEGREPIANMHTFSKAINFSPEALMDGNVGKLPLRNILAQYLGRDFAFEDKVGFPVDLTKVFDNPKGMSSYELWFSKNLEVLER